MKTTYTNFEITVENLFGDNLVSFEITAHQEGKSGRFCVFFHTLVPFLKKHYPEQGKYIQQIRKSLGGYGPKEDEVLAVLEEEDFDFEQYVILYIEKNQQVEAEIERQTNMRNTPETEEEKADFRAFFSKFEGLIPKNPINKSKFLDTLEQVVLAHLIDNYPELTNAEPEDIEKLNTILGEYIPKLGYDLIDHIEDIRDREA